MHILSECHMVDGIAYNPSKRQYVQESEHAKNLRMIEERSTARAEFTKPLVGDWVRRLDGAMHRFSHAWHDGIQTSKGGSYYLNNDGTASMSGGLDPSIPYGRLRDTGERLPAAFWFFHNNWAEASNGVQFFIPVRVWEEIASC